MPRLKLFLKMRQLEQEEEKNTTESKSNIFSDDELIKFKDKYQSSRRKKSKAKKKSKTSFQLK